ncbi:MAG TPA: aspartate carbamoyltransferase catalytic subunit [Candidatus Pseudogracilibacillus intestinigallinarum]|uniref:Aspartate carbamoyltransferase n=1 Tax=Candidatus Pseudogracilibacillus intestinigallinarum TaxID=2838742 RepID=A0A9D1PL22_9BACI|nr:aspartate carbamoyltransferase catalytic subunit [Candidatus Pseudogracilibacillus intestinigallinarum]
MKHFLSVEHMTKEEIIALLDMAEKYRQDEYELTKQVFSANLFFEPSTRTKMSFIVAERRLGIEALEFNTENSSMKKGETLYDTAKTFEAIGADVLVIRHESDDWADELKDRMNVPIVNAGAGKKDHPTQSLLDAITIYQEFGSFDGLNIVIAGDIKHSRVARSNAQMLTKLGANVYFTGAPDFMDDSLAYPYVTMDEAIEMSDVLMLLRIQHERHDQFSSSTVNYNEHYGLTIEREKKMKEHAIVLHPGPVNRGVEIDTTLVECDRSRIFKQMSNGVYVRMAVLTTQLLKWGIIHEHDIKKRNSTFGGQPVTKMRSVN